MLIRFIARFFSYLPLVLLHGVGFVLGWLAWGLSASYRQLFRSMLTQALGPHHPDYHAVLRRAIGETGKGLLELPYVWFREGRSSATRKVVCDDWPVVQRYLDAGRPLIILTPHMGCFEVAARYYAEHFPITVLYRPNRNADLQSMIEMQRSRDNLSLAPTDLSGVRRLLKALKRGESIGILPDQVPSNGEGIWANVWGKPAYTMNLPAKLRQQTGAGVVLAVARRLPWGKGWRLEFTDIEAHLPADPVLATDAINREVEKVILLHPEQYYWPYNRYKVPDGAPPITSTETP